MKTEHIPIYAALIAATAAITGFLYNASAQRELVRVTAREQLALERQQFQSNLMIRAIDPNNREKSIEAIRFLIRAGFVSEDNSKVLTVLKDTSFHIPLSTELLPIPAQNPSHYDYSTTLTSPIEYPSGRERLKRRHYEIIPYGKANTRVTFTGIISDALTSKPLAGATVAALTTEAPEVAITGVDGKFTLHYPYHKWELIVERPGYQKYHLYQLDGPLHRLNYLPLSKLNISLHMIKSLQNEE